MTDKRKRSGIMLFIILIVGVHPVFGWVYKDFSFDTEARAAMMADAGVWNPYAEIKGTFHGADAEFRYHSLTAGTYYRAAPWLKVGAFYRLQAGARHIEDWKVFIGPPDGHFFEDTAGRYESLIYLDATPRFLLPQLPGRDWVAQVKTRYFYNFSNNHQTVLLRPGVTYVFPREREPVVNLSLNYAAYLALNFNNSFLYSQGPYVTALWHASELVKVEGRVSYQVKTYDKNEFGDSWKLKSSHLTVGVGVIFTPDFTMLNR